MQKKFFIETNVVDSEIPLLLSKAAMKKAGSKLDFCYDTATMLGENVKLSFTKLGHYCIPIGNKKQLISQNGKDQVKLVLRVSDLSSKGTEEKRKMVLKLYQQFSHPSKERLRSLVTCAGIKDQEFLKLIETVSNECEVPSPKPIVGYPVQECLTKL